MTVLRNSSVSHRNVIVTVRHRIALGRRRKEWPESVKENMNSNTNLGFVDAPRVLLVDANAETKTCCRSTCVDLGVGGDVDVADDGREALAERSRIILT